MFFNNENYVLHALRGATTCEENSLESINKEVSELVKVLIRKNNLRPEQIVSIIFSVTKDLDATFPAAIARKNPGWENVALIDCQQMFVKADLKKCIRIMAYVWLPKEQIPKHPYLRNAKALRPDR